MRRSKQDWTARNVLLLIADYCSWALLLLLMVWALLWAVRSGQFDDLEGPAHRILMDEDETMEPIPDDKTQPDEDGGKS